MYKSLLSFVDLRLNKNIAKFGDISHSNEYLLRLPSTCMKLRIRGNSVRLRLTKGEVDRLAETRMVEDAIDFGTASEGLRYELRIHPDEGETTARFRENCLSILISETAAKNWIGSEQAGIEAMKATGNNKFLRVVVEKDFACLKERPGEDETDAFPNPLGHGKC